MKIKKNLALIGMPAVGKSTVGVLLAKKLGFAFLDTDILIQTREKMTLAQIIARKGLERFLEIEESHLLSLDCSQNLIATGGSVIYKEKAMALLMAKLLVIAQEQRAAEIADIRGDIVEAAWGNQIRNYVFHPYQMVKDLRTQHETTDVQGVMDGDLDPFIQSLLHAGVDVGASSDD